MLDEKVLDPNIRGTVVALNQLGYRTLYSCAGGHEEVPLWEKEFSRGYITIEGKHRIKGLCRSLGLKRIKVEYTGHPANLHTLATFTGLGGPSYDWNLSGRIWNRDWTQRMMTGEELVENLRGVTVK